MRNKLENKDLRKIKKKRKSKYGSHLFKASKVNRRRMSVLPKVGPQKKEDENE